MPVPVEQYLPQGLTIDQLFDTLGHASNFAYAPPNVYPMSVPDFQPADGAERPVPGDDRLGLYAHVPFCNYSCSFCFYAKKVDDDPQRMARYVQAVRRELEAVPRDKKLTQLYFGGGTPTALTASLLDELLDAALSRFDRSEEATHTVESSPESVSDEHLAVLQRHGIGRVSIGIQSLDERILEVVNRQHTRPAAMETVRRLVGSGLMTNCDLIYGLPGQDEASFQSDFETLVQLGVFSVTAYNLRLNENTPVARTLTAQERLNLERLIRWRGFVRELADSLGFVQSRWHTFVRKESRFQDVTGRGNQFGVGSSARSRLGNRIYRNQKDLNEYLRRVEAGRSPVQEVFDLREEDRRTRYLALSLGEGQVLSRHRYAQEFQRDLDDDFGEPLRRLAGSRLLEDDGEVIRMSDAGKLIYDLVTLAFYPPSKREWLRRKRAEASSRFPVVEA